MLTRCDATDPTLYARHPRALLKIRYVHTVQRRIISRSQAVGNKQPMTYNDSYKTIVTVR